MNGAYGLRPPWDTDQAALNAAEILDEVKRKTKRYRERPDFAIDCADCQGERRRLARVYVGPDDDGHMCDWVVTSTVRKKGRANTPPLAVAVPQSAGDQRHQLTVVCPRCSGAYWLDVGGRGPNTIAVRKALPGSTTHAVVGGSTPVDSPPHAIE